MIDAQVHPNWNDPGFFTVEATSPPPIKRLEEALVESAKVQARQIRKVNAAHALSERELVAIQLVAEGLSNRDVGERMDVSEQTVRNHLQSAFRKLGVSSRIEALIVCVRAGLVRFP